MSPLCSTTWEQSCLCHQFAGHTLHAMLVNSLGVPCRSWTTCRGQRKWHFSSSFHIFAKRYRELCALQAKHGDPVLGFWSHFCLKASKFTGNRQDRHIPVKFKSRLLDCLQLVSPSLFFPLCPPIQILVTLLSSLAYPQKRGLPTFWNFNSDWGLYTPAHTHSRGGPMGLETGSGQIYPSPCQSCDLSTPGSVATDVADKREKKRKREKGKDDNI